MQPHSKILMRQAYRKARRERNYALVYKMRALYWYHFRSSIAGHE